MGWCTCRFVHINPANGKFFVGTKSVFNITPKLNYTDKDIDKSYPTGGLNEKLKIALAFYQNLVSKVYYKVI